MTQSPDDLTTRTSLTAGAARARRAHGPPRLVMLFGPERGRRFTLDLPQAVLGRSEGCEIQIDDAKVSREHCKIFRGDGDEWVVEDLQSRNGTMVNGETVTRHALEIGDRIQLSAETLLLFTRHDPLEDQLLHRQQMEVIGQLAAGIAHDFNNLLNVISASNSHLSSLEPSTPLSDPRVRECREDILEATSRAAELTGRLLMVARRREQREQSGGGRGVNVSELCDEAVQLVRRTFDRSVRIETDVAPGLSVRGDPSALHQVLMNLLLNARDAMPERGILKVRAFEQTPVAGESPEDDATWSPAPQIVVEVADTGVGMDEATRTRVFEPFFTTKAHGAGSGLGLATVYEVVTAHGGSVEVESELGAGAVFRVRLPAKPLPEGGRKANPKLRISTMDHALRGQRIGRVLVVDDQELVRRSLGRLLRTDGHEISFASDGQEAVDAYRAADPRPHVVLLDLDMPNLTGEEALAEIRAIDPDARVVLISGYFDEERKRRLIAAGATDLLAKPVAASRLREAIRLAVQLPQLDG